MLVLPKNSATSIGIVVTILGAMASILFLSPDNEESDETQPSEKSPIITTPIIRNPRYIVTDEQDSWKNTSIEYLYVIDTKSSNFSTTSLWIDILKNQQDSKKLEWWVDFKVIMDGKYSIPVEVKNTAFKLMRIKNNSKYIWNEKNKTFPTQQQLAAEFEDIYFYEYIDGNKTLKNNENIFKDQYIFLGIESFTKSFIQKNPFPNPLHIQEIKIYLKNKEDTSPKEEWIFFAQYRPQTELKTCFDADINMCKAIQ